MRVHHVDHATRNRARRKAQLWSTNVTCGDSRLPSARVLRVVAAVVLSHDDRPKKATQGEGAARPGARGPPWAR